MKKREIFGVLLILIIVSIFEFISAGQGSANVPITSTGLIEQGTDYNMKPGRLKFEFNEQLYAIQVRRIEKESVEFFIMTLDMNKQEDITAYILDNSFTLKSEEEKEIDLNKDGITDLILGLNEITSTGKYNSVYFADFSIKKISNELEKSNEENNTEIIPSGITGSVIQEPISEPSIILNQESKEQPTFLENIINFFKGLFE